MGCMVNSPHEFHHFKLYAFFPLGSRIKTTFEFGIASLDIKGVYAEDAGVVTCRAVNESGKNEVSCKLIVHSK